RRNATRPARRSGGADGHRDGRHGRAGGGRSRQTRIDGSSGIPSILSKPMNISKFFVDRPIFAAVLSVLILLAGLLSVFRLPISEYPEVVPPSVVVRAQFPGANPKVIAETVAAPLEEAINGVEGMLY